MILRQSTQVVVRVGQAVFPNGSNGLTPVTTLALGTADQAELLKAAGAATVDISAATFAAITGCDGWYNLTLTTSHTDTVGDLEVVIQDESLILPISVRFQVVEEAVYDALYAASAPGYLQPTTAGRTLDVTATGAAGIDWGNVENPTTSVDLSATAISLCDTTTTNTDMRGTDSAALASVCTEGRLAELDAANIPADLDAVLVDTGTTLPATLAALNDIAASDILTTQLTESYAADGVAPTLTQAVMLIQQMLAEKSITSTTQTVKRLDGATTAATFTLDDATSPTSITRTT